MSDSSKETVYRLNWRLRIVMAERQIRTVTDLTQRLNEIGVDISSQQVNRIANSMPSRLSMDVLQGLMTVLQCSAADLLATVVPAGGTIVQSAPPLVPKVRKTRRRSSSNQSASALPSTPTSPTGPRVSPFPINDQTNKRR
jgi:DNA-binding Xre family transcriptional regulator